MSKFFFDTEFIESGPKKPIQLISIGIVHECGATYQAISSEYNESDASEWVKQNVLANLGNDYPKSLARVGSEIIEFVQIYSPIEKPEFWAYYGAYDWVVFCQIFGTMMNLPKGWPMYVRDIKQLCVSLGNPDLPKQTVEDGPEHDALSDARWNKRMYEYLLNK